MILAVNGCSLVKNLFYDSQIKCRRCMWRLIGKKPVVPIVVTIPCNLHPPPHLRTPLLGGTSIIFPGYQALPPSLPRKHCSLCTTNVVDGLPNPFTPRSAGQFQISRCRPHQKYYVTNYEELGFSYPTRWKMIARPIPTRSLVRIFSEVGGSVCAVLSWEGKG